MTGREDSSRKGEREEGIKTGRGRIKEGMIEWEKERL